MPSKKISTDLNSELYFLTFTVQKWYYLFDRHNRWKILEESLKYCQERKQLKIFSYVFMLNHIHLIVQSPDVAGVVRDFKKYTAKKLIENLEKTEPNVAKLFKDSYGRYSIWQKTNMPQLIQSEKFFRQKNSYIEQNPVRKNYVDEASHWLYSSAHRSQKIKIFSLNDL